ncbi:MAG TPA: alpha/beta fold hydrolase [Actinomycetota bacterium]|nr:alpha/beta fold hydrolase [Actinomycetota bacterium]
MRATRPRRPPAIFAILLAVSVFAACSGEGPAVDLTGTEVVTFESEDGVRLAGRLFGDGETAVVLSHMRPADQSSWFRFADRLAAGGYLVLTYNFRGYCPGGDAGCSEGEREVASIWRDVVGAAEFVRSRGAGSVALVGASMGGTASLVAARREDLAVNGVVTLSAPASIEGLVADASLLAQIRAAKLFIAGVGDAQAARDAQTMFDQSPQPKRVEVLGSDDHGTDLLTGGKAEEVRRLIEIFLSQMAAG